MIKIINVTKIYNKGKHNECIALRNVSLSIPNNSLAVFFGPSGSGKTTLLSLIGAMAKPTSGRIFVNNKEITSLPEKFLSKFRKNNVGFVFQKLNLLKNLTVMQNLLIPMIPSGISRRDMEKKAYLLLERFGINKLADISCKWLSGGELQRVAIARALINDPILIIADEPSTNLDSENTIKLMDIFRELLKDNRTIIIASHDPIIFNSSAVNFKIKMRDGNIVND